MTRIDDSAGSKNSGSRSRKLGSRVMIVLRRMHLYAGLFLLPWVFLYGITGAMFNHYGLFPDAEITSVSDSALSETAFAKFPSTIELAQEVVDQLRKAAPESNIEIDSRHTPEFVNDVILQVNQGNVKHAVHIDPVAKSAWVASSNNSQYKPASVLKDVHNVVVASKPYDLAKATVPEVLAVAGINAEAKPEPMGWCKLNFIATVDDVPARVTYVLRDGHVDVTKYEGEPGMSPRGFFLRLHTSHGRPPHWNARMLWSVFVDVMAVAMVSWGVTGLVMWWQIKRTRTIGGAVMLCSVATAVVMYLSMMGFYAATKL